MPVVGLVSGGLTAVVPDGVGFGGGVTNAFGNFFGRPLD